MPKINESELKKEIKSGDFKNAYLLYGEESYLKEYYAGELKNKIVDKTFEHPLIYRQVRYPCRQNNGN